MIDIHTHILPHMDDGSGSLEETIAMLDACHTQGVTTVIATPHFYADSDEPEGFLARRSKALKELEDVKTPVTIIHGAEVRYFTGCGRTKEMDSLMLGDTGHLLLELPDTHFPMSVIDDLGSLMERGIHPIIAHLNRCRVFDDEEFIDFCNEEGILIQLNTECIVDRRQRRRAIDLMTGGRVHFLATDCHDIRYRRPNKQEALAIITGMAGGRIVQQFTETEERILHVTA